MNKPILLLYMCLKPDGLVTSNEDTDQILHSAVSDLSRHLSVQILSNYDTVDSRNLDFVYLEQPHISN